MSNNYHYDFVGGPLNGQRVFSDPIDKAPMNLKVGITSDLKPYDGKGAPAGYAEYDKRMDNGKWKYFYKEINRTGEAAETIFDLVQEAKRLHELSPYTSEQLINELVERETFAGVVVFAVDGVTQGRLPPNAKMAVATSKRLSNECVIRFLQMAIDNIKDQN